MTSLKMDDKTVTAPPNKASPSIANDANLAKDILQCTSSAIFDDSYSTIHQIIRERVSELPFLDGIASNGDEDCDNGDNNKIENDESRTPSNIKKPLSGEQKMYRFISNVYDKFIDSAQLYVEHELFTLDSKKFSKKKRERLLQAFKHELDKQMNDGHGVDDKDILIDTSKATIAADNESGTIEEAEENQQTTVKSFNIPTSMKDIPSPKQIQDLNDEITNLHKKLNQIKVQNTNLKSQLQSIVQTKDLSNDVDQVVKSSLGSYHSNNQDGKLQDALNAAMIGKNGLEESCQDGREIVQKLDNIKKARDEEQDGTGENEYGRSKNETKEFGDDMKVAFEVAREMKEMNSRPQKKLTLEEDYQERLKSGMMKNGNKVFSNLLKR